MQLFICSQIQIKGKEVQVNSNSEIVNQLRKVLRAKPWYKFFLQDENWTKRYNVELESFIENGIIAKIIWEEEWKIWDSKVWMLIALPNKQEKLELIIQKLTEIGISHIFLWSSDRSQIKSLNENRIIRINKIIREAVEQSRWWSIPKIEVVKDIKKLHNDWNFVIFDLPKEETVGWKLDWKLPLLWVIWPEWWLSVNDYKNFPTNYIVKSLWDSVLRMETAAIVWWWSLKNKIISLE